MSRKTYRVNALRIVQIRFLADFFRKKFGVDELALGTVIERMLEDGVVEITILSLKIELRQSMCQRQAVFS